MRKGIPVITDMQIIPAAGYDSMLMSVNGCHTPVFTRTLVILKDSAGHIGLGETQGGDDICELLKSCIPLIAGQKISIFHSTLDRIGKTISHAMEHSASPSAEGEPQVSVRPEWAIECALLDLLGQYLDVPMCELLGNGRQRDQVELQGCLYYVGNRAKAPILEYLDESGSSDPWFQLRRREMLTAARIVEQADVLHERYGFHNFKLKGGVLKGADEMKTIQALKKHSPGSSFSISPDGAWSLNEAIGLCRSMKNTLACVEDPCGPEPGFSGRETLAEFRSAINLPVASSRCASNWRLIHHACSLKSADIVLIDPHTWGLDGSARMSQLLNGWNLTWGCHSDSCFDITLTAFAHIAAAAPGKPAALDTHWMWQDGQNLLKDTPIIVDGYLQVPKRPGLGVHVNMDRIADANRLYNRLPPHRRSSAAIMQYLIAGWQFEPGRPALVR